MFAKLWYISKTLIWQHKIALSTSDFAMNTNSNEMNNNKKNEAGLVSESSSGKKEETMEKQLQMNNT